MKLLTGLLAVLLLVMFVFVGGNWAAIMTEAPVWLGVGTVSAPIGLFVLVGFGVLGTCLLLMLLVQQATALTTMRRAAREISVQRKLADEAEASRFTELRKHLDTALAKLAEPAAAAGGDARDGSPRWKLGVASTVAAIGVATDAATATGQAGLQQTLLARIDQLEAALQMALTETDNSLSAYLGTLDERIERLVETTAARPAT